MAAVAFDISPPPPLQKREARDAFSSMTLPRAFVASPTSGLAPESTREILARRYPHIYGATARPGDYPDPPDIFSGALEEEVRREWDERHAQQDPYPSQEFVASLNTGRGLAPERWREREARDAKIDRQTEALAAALEAEGITARGPDNVVAIGLVTGQVESVSRYRVICFLPAIAQRERRPMLNELTYFRRHHHNHKTNMRMSVVTTGTPIPVPSIREESIDSVALRDRIQNLHRNVSKYAEWARREFGVEVVYRGTEFTIKQRKGDDFLSVHPHANLLHTPPIGGMPKGEWRRFLREAPKQFGGSWWKDCGRLRQPEEAIKYPFKPAELEGLKPFQVAWLHRQTFGLKMAQPLGEFKAWRNEELFESFRAEGALKPVKRRRRKVVSINYAAGPKLGLCSVRRRGAGQKSTSSDTPDLREHPPPENLVLCVTAPQRRFSPYAEPCALVMNHTLSPSTEWGEEALEALRLEQEKVLPVWYMNGAPDPAVALAVGRGQAAAQEGEAGNVRPFSVHTRRSTVRALELGSSARAPPGADGPSSGSFEDLGVIFSVG